MCRRHISIRSTTGSTARPSTHRRTFSPTARPSLLSVLWRHCGASWPLRCSCVSPLGAQASRCARLARTAVARFAKQQERPYASPSRRSKQRRERPMAVWWDCSWILIHLVLARLYAQLGTKLPRLFALFGNPEDLYGLALEPPKTMMTILAPPWQCKAPSLPALTTCTGRSCSTFARRGRSARTSRHVHQTQPQPRLLVHGPRLVHTLGVEGRHVLSVHQRSTPDRDFFYMYAAKSYKGGPTHMSQLAPIRKNMDKEAREPCTLLAAQDVGRRNAQQHTDDIPQYASE